MTSSGFTVRPTKLHETRALAKLGDGARNAVLTTGQWVAFIWMTFVQLPLTLIKYKREVLAQMNSLAWGRGSLIVDGGVISVLLMVGVAAAGSLALEAYAVLNIVGFSALSGIVAGVGAIRVIGPLVGGIAFATQTGCRMTAEIGSMRIAEEIDALEVTGIRPIPYVVGTRLIGGLLCIVPGYCFTIVTVFVVINFVITGAHPVPSGTYHHYFVEFVNVRDLTFSAIKVTAYALAATIIHCYYGFFASGGPVGVGRASGRAIRASLVAIMVLDLTTTIALWGLRPEFVFKG